MIRALRGDSNTNIIATPSIVTMDNQEAQIKVAQEVPFVTGQYTSTGGNNNGNVNPFQTIQRQEVGTILKITPQINEGDSVMLKIEQESSSIAGTSSGAVDLVTNKRTINTNVLIEDGGTIVLGGLIRDTQTSGEQRVPFLGRIPIIGEVFKTRSAKKTKTNLMVFIQPRILRDGMPPRSRRTRSTTTCATSSGASARAVKCCRCCRARSAVAAGARPPPRCRDPPAPAAPSGQAPASAKPPGAAPATEAPAAGRRTGGRAARGQRRPGPDAPRRR